MNARVLLIGWVAAAAVSCGPRVESTPGPIVLISIDTLRADRLPIYGSRAISTPAIDALAREGAVFERALSHSPQTLPAHASIFTGLLPFEHGVRDNVGFTLRPHRTLASLLQDAGFRTGGFVSAFVLRARSGIAQGFGTFDDEMPPAGPDSSMGNVQRSGRETLARAVRWIGQQPDGRFFLFFHLYEPHKPYEPPREYRGAPSLYEGEIVFADALVGELAAALNARGFLDGAVITILSDHGEGLGDHGEQEHGIFLYDETIRVPLIVRAPKGARTHARIDRPVQQIDVLPTVVDYAGVAVPPELKGMSLRAAIEGAPDRIGDRGVYSETMYGRFHFGWSELYALTDARFRYVRAPRPELYDLTRDPRERVNAAFDRATTAAAMRSALDRLIANRPIEPPQRVSAEDRERFMALGYIASTVDTAAPASKSDRTDPKDGIALLERYREGVNLRSEGRLEEAARMFRAVVARDPGMLDVWLQLAQTLTRLGRDRDVIDALRHAVRLKPDLPEGLIGIANASMRLRDFETARRHAELARTSQPARAHEVLARIALARGRDAEALAEAKLAHQADPSLALPTFIEGALLHRQGRFAEALACFERAAEQLRPRGLTLPELHFLTGDALAQLERYEEAEREFREEMRLFPENARAYISLALLHGARGRRAEAAALLETLTKRAPTPENHALAARASAILGLRR